MFPKLMVMLSILRNASSLVSVFLFRCFCGCCVDIANIPDGEPIPLDQISPTVFVDYDAEQSSVPEYFENNSDTCVSIYGYNYNLDQPSSSGS